MSRFYASIQGSRGEATRMGSRNITGHIRGWDVGVQVDGGEDPGDGGDAFQIYATQGSRGTGRRLVGTVQLIDGEPTFTPANDREQALV